MSIIALIPARGGSKGLPRKNIKLLNNLPLISWTINAASQSSKIERVFVSTEDKEIAKTSKKYGAEIIDRPTCFATDEASSIDVILHAIKWLKHSNINVSTIVLLQPTSPLRNSQHIDEALEIYNSKEANLVLSAYEPTHTPLKSYILDSDGSITGLYNDNAPYMRRQDLPIALFPNGAIYAFSVQAFVGKKAFPTSGVFPYIMPRNISLDIDSDDDMKKTEILIKELNNE